MFAELRRKKSESGVKNVFSSFKKKDEQRERDQKLMERLTHRLSMQKASPNFHLSPELPNKTKIKIGTLDMIARVIESPLFNTFIVLVVLIDFCLFFLDATSAHSVEKSASLGWGVCVAAIFAVEMCLKFVVYGFQGMLTNTWNLVDCIIAILTVVGVILEFTIGSSLGQTTTNSDSSFLDGIAQFCQGVMAIRLVRVIRIFRLFNILNSAKVMSIASELINEGDVRMPLILCLDILERVLTVLRQPHVKELVGDQMTEDDIKWVMNILQSEKLYFPTVQMDESLPEEVKLLLGSPPMNNPINTFDKIEILSKEETEKRVKEKIELKESIDLQNAFNSILTWQFDPFYLDNITNGKPLVFVSYYFFIMLGLIDKYNIDSNKLINWLNKIENGYKYCEGNQDKPINRYHNNIRASSIVCDICYILIQGNVVINLPYSEILAFLISVISLDYQHTGTSNLFLSRSSHELSIRYNDVSSLENHHASSALQAIISTDSDFLSSSSLPFDQLSSIRKLVIKLILSSDPNNHFTLLSKFSAKLIVSDTGFKFQDSNDRLLLMSFLIHTCDHSAPTKPSYIYKNWNERYLEELYIQGDEERLMGFNVSLFMDRSDQELVFKELQCKVGMLTLISAPLIDCVYEFLLKHCLKDQSSVAIDNLLSYLNENKKSLLSEHVILTKR